MSNSIVKNAPVIKFVLAVLFAVMGITAYCQEQSIAGKETFHARHSFSIAIGHQHVFNGRDSSGNSQTLIIPFWAIDYNFQFAPKFSIGVHTDFILETFLVEKKLDAGTEEEVNRTRPIAPAIMGFYKPTEHWSFGLGVGGEFAKEENFLLARLAIEYSATIGKDWEVFGGPPYDFRFHAYDS